MAYTAENGNFEGRSRARGGFGNETGQTERRGRNGEAQAANRNAINRAASMSAPSGPFKSPMYDASWQNLAKLGRMVGPMIANPGIGLAAPLAHSILSGDVYGAFGVPRGWSSYSPRDIDPLGSNPRGNTGGRDIGFGSRNLRDAILAEALRRQQSGPPETADVAPAQPAHQAPAVIGEQVPGLPFHGVPGPRYGAGMPRHGKASGYGGAVRRAPISFPTSYL